MSNLSDFFATAAGGSPLPYQQFVLGQSKTWTVPTTGKIKVVLTGGGGQGAFVPNSHSTIQNNENSGTGGGAGGYSEKLIEVTAGETFTVTIGAGGFSSVAVNSLSGITNGNNGGNSSFVTASAAESVNMIANGGGGGQTRSGTMHVAHTLAGGLGGTSSGGDSNYTGGAGGYAQRAGNNQYNAMVTGGGAVSMYGTAYHGGDIYQNSGAYSNIMVSGGAGVGGHGGGIVTTAVSTTYARVSSGGSASKDGFTMEESGANASLTGLATKGAPNTSATISVLDAQGNGGNSNFGYNQTKGGGAGGYGGGSGGCAIYNQSNNIGVYGYTQDAGGFGGGGAFQMISGANYASTGPWHAGHGGVGGGGGGAFSGRFHQMTSASGRKWATGGNGVCIIMYI